MSDIEKHLRGLAEPVQSKFGTSAAHIIIDAADEIVRLENALKQIRSLIWATLRDDEMSDC